jgi:hypothetical protein
MRETECGPASTARKDDGPVIAQVFIDHETRPLLLQPQGKTDTAEWLTLAVG